MSPTEEYPALGIATWGIRDGLWVSVNLGQTPPIGIVADNSIIHLGQHHAYQLGRALTEAVRWVDQHTPVAAGGADHLPGQLAIEEET